MMNVSYWEHKTWLSNIDFTIIGSGIVGLHCALRLREKHPKSKIVVLERGTLPNGASTKNAGFACFGSLSEILDDLQHHTEEEVTDLVNKRWTGLQLLREQIGDKSLQYKNYGGYELFEEKDSSLFSDCTQQLKTINQLLHPIFKKDVFSVVDNLFAFQKTHQQYIYNAFEAQIDTGRMMQSLLQLCAKKNIVVLNGVEVLSFDENKSKVTLQTNGFGITTHKLFITTNGFAKHLIDTEDIIPARAQILITKPIPNLHIKGTFHLDKGYYYFRNIDNRILLGGGRNLDFKTEETTTNGLTEIIQNKLNTLLHAVILPQQKVEIEHRWSGIMGIGKKKSPIVKQVSEHVFCGIRLGGMGIAIGSLIGKETADLL